MVKVILTRSKEDIEKDRKLFEKEGLEVIPLPLIETKPLEFSVPKEDFEIVIFPSAKAVKYFLEKAKLSGKERIIVVGKVTGKALEKYGYKAYELPENYYGEEIVKMLKGEKGKVLIPRSREGREEIIKDLESMGFEVMPLNVYTTKIVLYQREEFIKKLSEGDFIVFASPSAVRGFFANLPKEEGINFLKTKKVVCIGKTTNEELIRLSGMSGLMPERPSMEEVVRLIKNLARSLQ